MKFLLSNLNKKDTWLSLGIPLVFGPVVGMCRLGQGWLATKYFLAFLLCFYLFINSLFVRSTPIDFFDTIEDIVWLVWVVGAYHCFLVATKGEEKQGKWYSKWGVLIPAIILEWMFIYNIYSVPAELPRCYEKVDAFERGDDVIFKIGRRGDDRGRIIGIPGDTIELKDKIIYINGDAVPKVSNGSGKEFVETLPNGKNIIVTESQAIEKMDNFPSTYIPEGFYFILYDYRAPAYRIYVHDSRFKGLISQNRVMYRHSYDCLNK